MKNYVNLALAKRQELDEIAIASLNKLHEKMVELKSAWLRNPNKDLKSQLGYLTCCEGLEFEMQVLWKFNKDAARHTHRSYFTLPDDRKR